MFKQNLPLDTVISVAYFAADDEEEELKLIQQVVTRTGCPSEEQWAARVIWLAEQPDDYLANVGASVMLGPQGEFPKWADGMQEHADH